MSLKKIKYLSIIMLMFCQIVFSQNQRFAYEYISIPDSTKRENVKKELLYLDINAKGSKFYDREAYVADSIMKADMNKQIQNMMNGGERNINIKGVKNKSFSTNKITKNYADQSTKMEVKIAADTYNVWETRKLNWNIFPEIKKIGEYNCQKASLDFAGRQWTAWFSLDIPFQDGPYKFWGLPGIIVQIEDQTTSHIFKLVAASKYVEYPEKISEPKSQTMVIMGSPVVDIDNIKFKKIYIENRNDPAKSLKMLPQMGEGAIIKMIDGATGKEVSVAEMTRNIQKNAKERLKSDNNILELDLLY